MRLLGPPRGQSLCPSQCLLAEGRPACLQPASPFGFVHVSFGGGRPGVWPASPFGFVPLSFCGGRSSVVCLPFRICSFAILRRPPGFAGLLSLSGLLLSQTCKDNNGKPRGSCSASALLSIGANSQNFRAATGGSYGPKNDACEVPVFRCFWRPKISALLAVLS